MDNYYDKNLSSDRLKRVYELAPPRVRQYLEAEIAFVLTRIEAADFVLELGCGYGRVLERLASKAKLTIGIDTSQPSLLAAAEFCPLPNVGLARMNAISLGFKSRSFDRVVCIQNGISAFHVDPLGMLRECVRVTKSGGRILVSTYSERFWNDRLEWFRLQSQAGLLGQIDWDQTGEGVIVCTDGFRATTFTPEMLNSLAARLDLSYSLYEVDGSSLFCEIFS